MKFDFMGYRFHFITASVILIVLSIFAYLVKGFNYGIDFKGGNIIHLRFASPMDETQIKAVFKKIPGLYFSPDQIIIQAVSGGAQKEFILQYPAPEMDEKENAETHSRILKQLKEAAPYEDESLEVANVGPTLGVEMKRQGVRAAVFSCLGILLYLAWRFDLYAGSGAVIALFHDLIITCGFVLVTGTEFDVSVLAALLTMLGHSVNDTIVVFDRIRENRRISREPSFTVLINDSVNATLERTINTSITTLFSLVALILVGGSSIQGFAQTLTVGVIVGTYSSTFIASPILLYMTGDKLDRKRR